MPVSQAQANIQQQCIATQNTPFTQQFARLQCDSALQLLAGACFLLDHVCLWRGIASARADQIQHCRVYQGVPYVLRHAKQDALSANKYQYSQGLPKHLLHCVQELRPATSTPKIRVLDLDLDSCACS